MSTEEARDRARHHLDWAAKLEARARDKRNFDPERLSCALKALGEIHKFHQRIGLTPEGLFDRRVVAPTASSTNLSPIPTTALSERQRFLDRTAGTLVLGWIVVIGAFLDGWVRYTHYAVIISLTVGTVIVGRLLARKQPPV